jgi:hypothetical protein
MIHIQAVHLNQLFLQYSNYFHKALLFEDVYGVTLKIKNYLCA